MIKTIVIGLGNPAFGNHGVGWKVADEVKRYLASNTSHVDVEFLSLGGLGLMERLIGYDRAILIDALNSDETSGSVLVMHLEDMPRYSAFHTAGARDVSLQDALEIGKCLGAKMPRSVMVVGITTEKSLAFGNELTPEVRAAIPAAKQAALELLDPAK
jgi:hydrogenase maturation protease